MSSMLAPSRNAGHIALDNAALRREAPSIFAASPYERMSGRYKFIPTIEVVDVLREAGFMATLAMQSRSRIAGKGEFTKHMIKFRRNTELVAGTEIPELVLVNSHDGTSSYQFHAGIYRVICANGMIAKSHDQGSINVRHKGGSDFHQQIIDATFSVMDEAPRTMQQIEGWKQLALPAPAQRAFAEAVKELVPDKPILATALLTPKRMVDRETNLWTTANVVQENLIRGGVRGRSETGRRTTTREVKGVSENLRLNQAIWKLTEEMGRIMGV